MKYKQRFFFAVVFVFLSFCVYAKNNPRSISGDSREAGIDAMSILSEASDLYSIEKNAAGDYVFYPSKINQKDSVGFIFYPGGKVKSEAYLPLMKALAEKGYLSILVYMPKELAVFNQSGAKKFVKKFPEITHWFIGGHSLGGAIAASYAANKTDVFDGIVLCAAYSTKKINEGISVLSVYGSCDEVLARDKYEKYRPNLPEKFEEFLIEGGCHSYFGDYGMQDGDGVPAITREKQIALSAEKIDAFIKAAIENQK